jgi:hypothetical protein
MTSLLAVGSIGLTIYWLTVYRLISLLANDLPADDLSGLIVYWLTVYRLKSLLANDLSG